jgi:hypothetical protein
MKLTDLNPRWCLGSQWTDSNGTMHFPSYDSASPRKGMGMTFLCPTHLDHRLGVYFDNPVDGLPPQDKVHGIKYLWTRTGNTFEDMTVNPSINAHGEVRECWHGYITNGEIR